LSPVPEAGEARRLGGGDISQDRSGQQSEFREALPALRGEDELAHRANQTKRNPLFGVRSVGLTDA
jgi:hypothetical protein